MIYVTTNITAVGGVLSTITYIWIKYKKSTLSMTLNVGLAAVTAGCDAVSPGGALIIGVYL